MTFCSSAFEETTLKGGWVGRWGWMWEKLGSVWQSILQEVLKKFSLKWIWDDLEVSKIKYIEISSKELTHILNIEKNKAQSLERGNQQFPPMTILMKAW